MWVMQVENLGVWQSTKGRLSHYMPILHYPHQLVRRRNKNTDAQICVAHACDNQPKGRLSLWSGHYIYYMVDIDNLNFRTNLIKGQLAQSKIVLLHRLRLQSIYIGSVQCWYKETQLVLKVWPAALLVKLVIFFEIYFYGYYSKILFNVMFILN